MTRLSLERGYVRSEIGTLGCVGQSQPLRLPVKHLDVVSENISQKNGEESVPIAGSKMLLSRLNTLIPGLMVAPTGFQISV